MGFYLNIFIDLYSELEIINKTFSFFKIEYIDLKSTNNANSTHTCTNTPAYSFWFRV